MKPWVLKKRGPPYTGWALYHKCAQPAWSENQNICSLSNIEGACAYCGSRPPKELVVAHKLLRMKK
jgi:hypothetical protein